MLPPESFQSEPEAFARLDSYRAGVGHRFPVKEGFEAELGRALMLSNVAALKARYPRESWAAELAEARAFVFALTERDPVVTLKAIQCFEYQCNETDAWEQTWAAEVCRRLRLSEIERLPGYNAAPWGIDDPEGGPLEPGTAGAPVSILSMIPGGKR